MIGEGSEKRTTAPGAHFHQQHAASQPQTRATVSLGDFDRQEADFARFFEDLRHHPGLFCLNGLGVRQDFLRDKIPDGRGEQVLFVSELLRRVDRVRIRLCQEEAATLDQGLQGHTLFSL